MKRWLLPLFTTGALVLGLSAPASAAPPGGPGRGKGPGAHQGMHGHRPGGPLLNAPLDGLKTSLSLTDAQVGKLRDIRQRFKRETQADWKKSEAAKDEMRALWRSADIPSKKAVMTVIQRRRAHRMAFVDAMVDARIEAMRVLTRAQRTQLASMPGRGGGRGRRAR